MNNDTEHDAAPDADLSDAPSKTRRKAEAHALQDIGTELVALNRDQLDQVEMPENLRDAVISAKRMTKHEARRRQLQYIGKLMRNIDPEPIRAKLDTWRSASAAQVAQLHHIERWRERLLAEPDALALFANEYPGADLQQVRTLLRNVQKEREQNKPPKSYRALFQILRDIILA